MEALGVGSGGATPSVFLLATNERIRSGADIGESICLIFEKSVATARNCISAIDFLPSAVRVIQKTFN